MPSFLDKISEIDASILSIDERAEEIEARAAELQQGLDSLADKAELEMRNAEADSLASEKNELTEKRQSLIAKKEELVRQRDEEAKKASATAENLNERKTKMPNEELEKRATEWVAAARQGNGVISSAEVTKELAKQRSIALSGVSAPIGNNSEVGSHFVVPDVLKYVDAQYVPGINGWNGTYAKNDGSGEGTYFWATAKFSASDEFDVGILSCSNVDIKKYVVEKLTFKVLRQLSKAIIAKLGTQTDSSGTAMYNTDTLATVNAETVRDIALAEYGGDDVYGQTFIILSRATLVRLGKVRGANEKKAVFDINYPDPANTNVGVISDGSLALTFIIDNAVTGIIAGHLSSVEVKFAKDINVRISYEEKMSQGLVTAYADTYAAYGFGIQHAFTVYTITA